jgi:hypothetical protein
VSGLVPHYRLAATSGPGGSNDHDIDVAAPVPERDAAAGNHLCGRGSFGADQQDDAMAGASTLALRTDC